MRDVTMLRAIANALWKDLRRNRWQTHTVTRDLSKSNPTGYQAGPRTATIAQAPSMNAVVELHHECFIRTVLYGEEWPGKTSHAIRLTRDDYETALEHAFAYDLITQLDFDQALAHATCRQPFHQQANRHGQMRLRRNATDEAITPAIASTLERIAAATQVLPIDETTLDDYLIGDDDIDLERIQTAVRMGA